MPVSKGSIGVGIDFGTTNSVAAIFDGKTTSLVPLEAGQPILPSALYIDKSYTTTVGQKAIERYVSSNTGRKVELVPEVIGETAEFAGSMGGGFEPVDTVKTKMYGASVIDSGLEGRLFRGTKRLLGDSSIHRLMVFEQAFRLVALITPLLLDIRKSIEKFSPTVDFGYLGRPVNFEGKEKHRNELAISRLSDAFKFAGIKKQTFYPEPIAAAISYLQGKQDLAGESLLSFDFGGGTLDLCVLRRTQGSFQVVATHGVALGGDHIDQRIFRCLLFPLLGKGERWKRRGMDRQIDTPFPFSDYEELLVNWPISYTLNQNRYTAPIMDCISQGHVQSQKFERLRDLIQQNLGYVIFQEIKNFKAQLSNSAYAELDIPEIDVLVQLTRAEFEELIGDFLEQIERALDDVLEKANLKMAEVDLVLRTGGSSLIPAVNQILKDRFPGRVVDHDPFTSVAKGLAIASYRSNTA
tara:strand:- start:653 stop:2053 length:1401 start_codon:yes stop_codon:yes gene_type:complete